MVTLGQEAISTLIGRDETLDRLAQRVEALKKGYRQNVALVGPRFIGKTFILRHFLEKIRRDPEIIPLYLLLTETDFEGLLPRWLGALLRGFLSWKGIAFPEEFQQLVKISKTYIPKTLERMRQVKRLAFQKKTTLAFRELIGLTLALHEETGKRVLLVLDEFQWLEGLDIADPLGQFGKEMMIQKDTFYLATSSEPHRAREIFSDRLSLLFGNFEIVEVGPLSFEALQSWMKARCGSTNIPESDLRLLGHLLNHHPYYFDLYWEEVERLLPRQNPAEWNRLLLQEALAASLFSNRGLLNRHFEFEIQSLLRLGRRIRPYVNVLVAVAQGRTKLLPIAAYLGKKAGETKKLLQRLIAEGVLTKNGSFYSLPDPLFRFWLRNVHQVKDRESEPDGERARRSFRERLERELRWMEEEDQKDLTTRFETLLREFRNDVVAMGEKRMRCPAFLELASRPTNGRYFPVLGRTAQEKWICQVYREGITEADVLGFSEEMKQSRRKISRKVMVALGGIELNAKLMAHENKIQIWDLEDLNTLFDLYGKQKVIL